MADRTAPDLAILIPSLSLATVLKQIDVFAVFRTNGHSLVLVILAQNSLSPIFTRSSSLYRNDTSL